jgi:hypothetical protein
VILYLDVQRAAEAVSMSPRWMRQQIAAGLPVLRLPGKTLIAPDVLREWMTSRYARKAVDLAEAHRLAEELTCGKSKRRKG